MWSWSRRLVVGSLVAVSASASLLVLPTAGSAVPGSSAVTAARAADRWTTTDAMVPVVVGPDDDVEIELDTRLYVPRGASRRDPRPAVLMTHGFGLDKTSNEVVSTARFLAAHGYLVLTWTSSGFGESGGCITLQSADWDVKGAMQLVDALLEPRRDVLRDRRGLVLGTIGGSYGGGIQLPLAAADRRIRATIPGRTWNTLQYSLDPNNLVVEGDRSGLDHDAHEQGVFKQEWTTLFFAAGTSEPASGGGGCTEAKLASGDAEEIAAAPSCLNFYLDVCRIFDLLSTTGDADQQARDHIARASAATFLDDVDAATLLVQGQSDTLFNLNDAAATYRTLRRRGVPVAMTWNSGGHGGYVSQPGECEAYDGTLRSVREMDACYLPQRQLQWLDHWLRGKGRPGPGFTWFEGWRVHRGDGPNSDQYAAARTFPLKRTTTVRLGADGLMHRRAEATPEGSMSFLNPPGGVPAAYTETSNFSGPGASPNLAMPTTEETGQHVAIISPRLKKPLDSVGIPRLRVTLENTNTRDLVLFVKVYDAEVFGVARTLVHRLITPVRIPADRVGKPVTISLAGFAHRFAAGHHVQLVLAATDQTSYNAKVADAVTVRLGPDARLTLPGRARFGRAIPGLGR